MGKINSAFTFTGSVGNLSAYKMRGSDKIIVRTKGGASKEKIRKHPSFANTRRINAEFGGCASTTRWLMRAIRPLKPMCDTRIAGRFNRFWKAIQMLDMQHEFGKRSVEMTRNPSLLEGFTLNENISVDTILRAKLVFGLDRETRSARIEIPALVPGVNFFPDYDYPVYTIKATLGLVPDMHYHPAINRYHPNEGYTLNVFSPAIAETEWQPVRQPSPATTLALDLAGTPPDDGFSLVLTIGIGYGMMYDSVIVRPVKYAGSAKILACV